MNTLVSKVMRKCSVSKQHTLSNVYPRFEHCHWKANQSDTVSLSRSSFETEEVFSWISTQRISLVAGEIFVIENYRNISNPKFLHLISEIVVSRGHLPKQVLVEGF